MQAEALEETLRSFIVSELALTAESRAIEVDDDLLVGGVIDSMGVMQLVAFIEDRLGVSVADEDIVPQHFRSVRALAQLVASKGQDGAGE